MYLSAERLALANQAVTETFEQSSVVWQAIPNWDTGDPSQTMVPNDNLTAPANVALNLVYVDFPVPLAQAISPTADRLLAKVIAATVDLAGLVDNAVVPALLTGPTPTVNLPMLPNEKDLLQGFIAARAKVEGGGYRAPSCLVTDTLGLQYVAAITIATGYAGTDVLLPPANINSLHRVDVLAPATDPDVRGWLLGRRQRIASGRAADASAGEEAVDLAVSIPPSLEVIGDSAGNVDLRVRIKYVTRVKDEAGLVVFRIP